MAFLKLPRFLRGKKARIKDVDETMRRGVISALSRELLYFPCMPSEVNGLDMGELERLSRELTQMGFEFRADRRTRWDGELNDAAFHRVFIHVSESCFASLSQTLKRLQGGECLVLEFHAPLKAGSGWVSGSNGKITPGMLFVRCPRCTLIQRPLSTAKDLFESVLRLRQAIATEIGFDPQQALSLEILDRVAAEHMKDRLAAVQSRSYIHEVREARKLEHEVEWVWRGEY
jgi:hypothetical protein